MYGQYLILFALMLTGYVLRKLKVIDDKMNGGLNNFIVYFAYPCLLVKNIGELELNGSLVMQFFLMFGLTCVCYVVYILLAKGYNKARKVPPRVSNVAELAMSMPNDGFMGFPVVLIFFGSQGLFFMMAHNVALNVFLFSYGIVCLRRNNKKKEKRSGKAVLRAIVKLLLNPNLVAIYIGIAFSFGNVPLDNPLGDYLSLIGNVATPMAMVYIGSSLVENSFLQMIKSRRVWAMTFMKLLVMPFATMALVAILPIPKVMKAALILGGAFPTAATVSMLAETEKQNAITSSKLLFSTTLLSMASIPFVVHCINLLMM